MLVFIDESGHPHPPDRSTRPVLLAVCIDERDARSVNTALYRLKKDILNREPEEFEAKANQLITRATFRNRTDKREFVESFFDRCRELPFTIFAVVMDKPQTVPVSSHTFLPMQFRFLLYRVQELLRERTEHANILFDGDGIALGHLSQRFNNFLYRSRTGQSLTNITDTPFFVDSRITPGIQIADMFASVVRQYHENGLTRGVPRGDAFLSAIARFYKTVGEKTVDLTPREGETWYGISYMSERYHYFGDREDPDIAEQTTPAAP